MEKLSNKSDESGCLEFIYHAHRFGVDKSREGSGKEIFQLIKAFFVSSHVKNKISIEVFRLAVENSEMRVNKLVFYKNGAKGNYFHNYGLASLRCHDHKYKSKVS